MPNESKTKPTEAVQLLRSIRNELRELNRGLRRLTEERADSQLLNQSKSAPHVPSLEQTQKRNQENESRPPPSDELKARVKREARDIHGKHPPTIVEEHQMEARHGRPEKA